jgi:hypothetical protein
MRRWAGIAAVRRTISLQSARQMILVVRQHKVLICRRRGGSTWFRPCWRASWP